ncbi:nitrous oxide reductase accessory protein NosL [Myroides sp. NP-2]|uniref:nitrous oxide reductase accessory protein NosL n=1 Tax=Myroides sp. NP-2 TaxID=2759945 RepID=UPI0015FAB8ED|nr:nitrous oxide reductase accessory protein NosL [Myroides sp. NP-2]MBB1149661.1 nitrous oxide reductase accessory protein NosL [Myroides sp. NP-2]
MKPLTFLMLSLLFVSCTVKVQPIEYGTDTCDFCKMGIVDAKHAAQLVTTKGKNYKFDAIECMLHYLADTAKPAKEYTHLLVADVLNPGTLIPAEQANFIVSKNIPSPMGAFLSATQTKEEADQLIDEFTGDHYTFTTIRQQLSHQ